jgi:hypothetical protein
MCSRQSFGEARLIVVSICWVTELFLYMSGVSLAELGTKKVGIFGGIAGPLAFFKCLVGKSCRAGQGAAPV